MPTRAEAAPTRRSQAPTIPSRARLSPPKRVTAPPVTVGTLRTGRGKPLAFEGAGTGRLSAIIGGCLFGACVGAFGMLTYFRVPVFSVARSHEGPRVTRSVAAPSPTSAPTPSALGEPAEPPAEQAAPEQTQEPAPTPPPIVSSSPSKARALSQINRPAAPKPSNSANAVEQIPLVRPKTHESIY